MNEPSRNVWPFISNDVTQMIFTFMDVHMDVKFKCVLSWKRSYAAKSKAKMAKYCHCYTLKHTVSNWETESECVSVWESVMAIHPNHIVQRKRPEPLDTFHFLCRDGIGIAMPCKRLACFNMRKACPKYPIIMTMNKRWVNSRKERTYSVRWTTVIERGLILILNWIS